MRTIWLIFALLIALPVCGEDQPLKPIRPGIPGKAPFWNGNAKQFIYPPAFDFKAFEGAARYRFTLSCVDGKTRSFDATEPWAPLTPVWTDVPVGTTRLKVQALDNGGAVIGTAGEREFHRAAAFHGPYGHPLLPYSDSAHFALDSVLLEPFVASWTLTGEPSPNYALYRYPAKIIGSLLTCCAMRAKENELALPVGRAAADYLIKISSPPGTPLEYFPPTYHNAKPTERENDNWTMLMTPAEAGQGYLDLYDATQEQKYLDAAQHIAATYVKLQLPSGTWMLKIDNQTGKPVAPIELIPSEVIEFLDRLVVQYDQKQFRDPEAAAVRWMMQNPVRTMNWQAQFDDAKLREPYQNLSKHEACQFACFLFRIAGKDEGILDVADDLLRFSEDQFVIWEQPPESSSRFEKGDNWFTPCSAEQYAMFEPISGSSGLMIRAYLSAYQATGKSIFRDKAQSLGNALTAAQVQYKRRYPTRMYKTTDRTYWINSTINTARAMEMLGKTSQ